MLKCWDEDPNNRPTFEWLHETITGFLQEEVNNSILYDQYLAIVLNRSSPKFWTSNLVFSRQTVSFFNYEHPFIDKTMVINEPAEPSACVLVLGSKLYPRMLNKDLSRFMQSLPRVLLTGWLFLSLTCHISYILEWLLICSINSLVRFEQDADGFRKSPARLLHSLPFLFHAL